MLKIGIGSDHGGVEHKAYLKEELEKQGYTVIDYGTQTGIPADYPDVANTVCSAYLNGEFDLGILICGTGIGMSISANKIHGIRAAHVTDCFSARMAREHNHAQFLCLGQRITGNALALEIANAFLNAQPQEGRHAMRVEKIMKLES